MAELQLLDFRHDHRPEPIFLEGLGIAVGHEGTLGLLAYFVAVGAHDVGQGRLSGPETGQVGVPPEVLGHAVKLGVYRLGIDLNAELFLARGKVCNGYFHGSLSLKLGIRATGNRLGQSGVSVGLPLGRVKPVAWPSARH